MLFSDNYHGNSTIFLGFYTNFVLISKFFKNLKKFNWFTINFWISTFWQFLWKFYHFFQNLRNFYTVCKKLELFFMHFQQISLLFNNNFCNSNNFIDLKRFLITFQGNFNFFFTIWRFFTMFHKVRGFSQFLKHFLSHF